MSQAEVSKAQFKAVTNPAKYIWSLRAPLFLLASIAVAPKTILLWILFVLLKPLTNLAYQRLPVTWQIKITNNIPAPIKRSAFLRDLGEGADQCLPFMLFWLYLCCAPFALVWIAGHWVRSFMPKKPTQIEDGFVFEQNKKRDLAQPENNFYYSKAFGIVMVAFFALGIPAFFSYSLYQNLHVDKDVQASPAVDISHAFLHSARIPRPRKRGDFIGGYRPSTTNILKVPPLTVLRPEPGTASQSAETYPTFVAGYNGYWPRIPDLGLQLKKSNLFFVHFYLVSLACALSVLFFRAWCQTNHYEQLVLERPHCKSLGDWRRS